MLTFGSTQGSIPLAVVGAGAAVVLVVVAGIVVRGPLSRVPENTLAFAVGVMLTTFGIFWGAEGAGVDWPGGDAALPVVLAFVVLMSLGYVTALRRRRLGPPHEALRALLVGLRRRRRLARRGGHRRRARPHRAAGDHVGPRVVVAAARRRGRAVVSLGVAVRSAARR